MNVTDERWKELGELLVSYSAAVKPAERVMIAMEELESYPLMHAVYEAAIKVGALPQVQFLSETLRHSLLKYGNTEQLAWVPEIEAYGMEWADVYYGLRAAHHQNYQSDIPPDRLSRSQTAMGRVSTLRWQKTRWCLVPIPNANWAQQAETDLETVTEMFFSACLINWKSESEKWHRWASKLNGTRQVRIIGKETDLTFSVDGRSWMVADGRLNMPDGEIGTAPIEQTVDGQIYFELPGILGGRLVHDMSLRWEKGKLVQVSSSTNQDFLRAIVTVDPGAGMLGEFAMGTNMEVTRFCRDSLIDEKIGGTMHIALGRAYPDCGGTNQSAIHWDIIKDIRKEGTVYADGQPILRNGSFLF